MAKLHSALTDAELHNPKGITSESTGSILALNQSTSKITASGDFVPSSTETYDLGSTSNIWKEIYVATSSINFVRPDGTILQQIKADEDGVIFTSGSTGIVANVSGSIISGSSLHIQGNAKVTGDLTLGGQITIGDSDSDDVVMEAEFSSSLIPNDDNAFDLGSASKQWKDIYVNGIGYIDQLGTDGDAVAAYISSGEIDGVTLGGESQVTITDADINGGTIDGVTIGVGSATTGNFTNVTGSVVSASSGIFTSVNIDGGTVDGITSLTAGGNLDIGAHGFRASTLTADSQTDGRVAIYGANGLLSEDSDLSFSGATLSATNLTSTGTISGSTVTGTTIGQNRADGVKTITIEANSIINQDLSTDADATLGTLSVGNVTSTGTVSGSAVYGTTLGQNTATGLKTISIEANSTVNQDLTTDANVTFGTIADVGNITSDGTISGSAVYGTTIGQNTAGGLKTLSIESNSVVNQDLSSDASVTFGGLTSTGDITLTGQATDVDLVDNNTSALSFDASGKAGILEIVTTNNAEKVKLSGGLEVEAQVSASGGVSGSFGHFTEIKHNTGTGLHTLTLNENLTVSDGQNIVLTGAGQENTITLNESLTIGDGSSGTLTYSAGSKTLTVEDNATVDQDLTKDADVQFASATLTGRLTAQEIVVSSSVSYITASFASGSNILGDSTDDTHKVTGSLQITGSGDIVGNFTVGTDSAYTLGSSGKQWSNVFTDNVTIDGQGRIDLDDDLDTSIRASADDVITFEAAGADQVAFTDGTIEPSTNDDIALGTSSKMFSDLFLGNGGVINFNNGNMSITHTAGRIDIDGGELRNDGLISGSSDLWIGSNSAYISSSAGNLELTGNIVGVTHVTSSGTITGSAGHFTSLAQNTTGGLRTISLGGNVTTAGTLTTQNNNVIINAVDAERTLTLTEDFTIGGGHAGTLTFSAGSKTLTVENTSAVNQDLTSDASVTFGDVTADGGVSIDNITIDGTEIDLSSGDLTIDVAGDVEINADGGDIIFKDDGADLATINATKVSGSQASTGSFGRLETVQANAKLGSSVVTLGGNLTTAGTFTTQNNNVIINAAGAARTLTLNESLTIGDGNDGTITFSGASKTLTVEDTSVVNQDLSSDASPTFAGLTSTGDVVLTGQATDIDLIDNNANALTFDAGAGGISVLRIDTTNSNERIVVTGDVSASGDFRSISTSTGSFGHLDVDTISGSGTVGTFSAVTITDSPLAVSSGGTGVETLANKAVLISQDSGDDQVGTAVMDGNGEFIIGGTSGPAVMAASTLAGDTLSASTGDGTVTLNVAGSMTGVTDISNTSLKVGRATNDEYFDFGTDGVIKVALGNVEEFRFAAGGTFHADADIVAFSSTVASDMNLKENITDMRYGLDTVLQLRGVEYDWKRKGRGHDVGVLAQEVEAVIPELVKENQGLNGRGKFKSVDYNKLVPILIESIKELNAKVESLQLLNEIDELKD